MYDHKLGVKSWNRVDELVKGCVYQEVDNTDYDSCILINIGFCLSESIREVFTQQHVKYTTHSTACITVLLQFACGHSEPLLKNCYNLIEQHTMQCGLYLQTMRSDENLTFNYSHGRRELRVCYCPYLHSCIGRDEGWSCS